MPKTPKAPDHPIDNRHGDGKTVHAPTTRDGHPVTEKPYRDAHGRDLAPGHDHIGRIDKDDFRRNIHGIQDRWDSRDHDYHWHTWDGGWRVCHHYDEFGYHWWGFYIGDVYFWTRYHNDGYWWFDPYWHRWVFLRDGRWWWLSPDGAMYLYADNNYYQYNAGDGGVVMTPDPTPAVDVPPGDPAPAPTPATYSLDGTRSISITGDTREAFLYDLTATDPNSPGAQGYFLGTQVAGAKFDYVTAADGTTQTASQVELSYDDPSALSVADINGQRRVDIANDTQDASLINLQDNTVNPVALASGVTGVTFNYADATNQNVQSIVLSVTDASGNVTQLTFDGDGNSLDQSTDQTPDQPQDQPGSGSTARMLMPTPAAAAAQAQTQRQKVEESETFRALKNGFGW